MMIAALTLEVVSGLQTLHLDRFQIKGICILTEALQRLYQGLITVNRI